MCTDVTMCEPTGTQEASDEEWSKDHMIPALKMRALPCEYCKKTCPKRFTCELCHKKCCRKDTFWCSAERCSYQICRSCQYDDAFRITNEYPKWLCKVCIKTKCRVCRTDSIVGKCNECSSSMCRKHIFYCGKRNCEHTTCVACQYAGYSRFELRPKGWCCQEHHWM